MKHSKDFENLYKTHFKSMYSIAMAILNNEDIARDIVQDVFMSVYDTGFFNVSKSYLLTATKNKAINYIRDYDIHKRIENLLLVGQEEYDKEEWPDEETVSNISKIISTELTPQQRKIMEMHFEDGIKVTQIAKNLELSKVTIFRSIRNAIEIICNKLKNYE